MRDRLAGCTGSAQIAGSRSNGAQRRARFRHQETASRINPRTNAGRAMTACGMSGKQKRRYSRLGREQPINNPQRKPREKSMGPRFNRVCGATLATAAVLASLAAVAPATAQSRDKVFELKLSHWVPPNHPLQKALEDWGAAVEKASGGTLKYKVFPAQQLGKAFDHYDMARDGIADLTYVNPGYQPGRFPVIAAGELPFLIANAKGGSQAIDAWYRKYAEQEMKEVKFCLAFVHDPGTFHAKTKKIVTPDDIKGMKIRPAHATMATFVTQLG